MLPRTEMWRGAAERGQQPLRMPGRGEPFHRPLALPGRLMRVLGPIGSDTSIAGVPPRASPRGGQARSWRACR
jgi:hypothetical protein